MNTTLLTPGVSTHFRWTGLSGNVMTTGKIYKILKWKGSLYSFLDDQGRESIWVGRNKVVDVSYEINLKEILEWEN